MRDAIVKKWIVFLVLQSSLAFITASGQTGKAGRESPFSIGFSARALAMGNTQTAFPKDPTAFYWNPGGMVVVDQTGMALSHTILFEGVVYSSIGIVYPTMNAGSFGIGLAGIGVGGIRRMDEVNGVPIHLGDMQYWWGKLTVSYALPLGRGLSIGINFNEHRQVLGTFSSYGFGMDAGVHLQFFQRSGLLRDLHFGMSANNVFPARLKLGTMVESEPYSIRMGVAKIVRINKGSTLWVLSGDADQIKDQDLRWHAGTEIQWNELLFLRAGMDNGNIVFGGGFRIRNLQLDYAYAQIGDPEFFPKSHRFSLCFYVGKTVTERRRLLEETRRLEIQQKIDEQRGADRIKRIRDGLETGKAALSKGDYFNARLEFSRVLTEDSTNKEIQQLLNETTEKERNLQQQHEEEMLREAKANEKRRQDMAFVSQQFQEALDAFNRGEYSKVIENCQQALERDSENAQIRTYLENTRIVLERRIAELVNRSKLLERDENLTEAYKALVQAKDLAVASPIQKNTVLAEIKRLDAKIGSVDAFQKGLERYENGDYQAAAQFLEKAISYEPENPRTAELYRNAKARSIVGTRPTTMTQDVKEKFSTGLKWYQDGKYQEAIRIWEEALVLDPNNVKIMDAIQAAKDKLNTFQKKP